MNLKLPLGLALAIIAAIVFGYICFLGFNYSSGGHINDSIVKAMLWALIPLILAVILWRLKSVNGNFKTYIIVEVVFLILFIVVAIIAFPKFTTSFNVYAEKKNIQSELQRNLIVIEEMYPTYEQYVEDRVNDHDVYLKGLIDNKMVDQDTLIACGFILTGLDVQKA